MMSTSPDRAARRADEGEPGLHDVAAPHSSDVACDVACVGILCADVLAKPIDVLPEKGRLGLLDQLQLQIGGCASNTAVDLARLGVSTTLIGKIGADGFGQFLRDTLRNAGVDTRGLRADPSVSTAASVLAIGSDGERSILHCLGSNAAFGLEDIDVDLATRSRVLFIAGALLMPRFDGPGAERLLDLAKSAGRLCCMDTAWDATGQWMRKIDGALPYLDWFMPSYEEARELSGETNPAAIAEVFGRMGTRNVIVKLGRDGCYVHPEREPGFFAAAHDVRVVDTTGAGDAFCAGFLTGLVKGWDAHACARLANAVGALAVTAIGTTAGVKSLEETLTFMKSGRQDVARENSRGHEPDRTMP